MKKFLIIFLFFFSSSFAKEYITEGLTENQITNIKVYTLKALNLSLNAYSELKRERVNRRNAKSYIESAIFFLNEATIYSPSYTIRKKIETLKKRIKIFPKEYYKKDLISIYQDINKFAGNLTDYEKIKKELKSLIDKYDTNLNSTILSKLENIYSLIDLPLIDTPLNNAKTFLAIAYDNLKAGRINKASKSIEISLDPMIKLTNRENLLLVEFKNLIYNSYISYLNGNYQLSKMYLFMSNKKLKEAYAVSIDENKDMIKGFMNQIKYIDNNFNKKDEILKEFIVIVRQIKNL
ncbi:MAG: hypothetical protein D6834_00215 [Aquificota bacterium]|nr:MAG: hypothetical protein D6834_00215 [Aquificota bacterium]